MVDSKISIRTRRIVEEFVACLFRGEKTMPILFYYPLSAPCRAVLLLGRLLNIEFELRLVDISKEENLLPEFVKVSFRTIIEKICSVRCPFMCNVFVG